MVFIKKYWSFLVLFLVMALVVMIKIPHLGLPHFWDEAWSYSPAVQYMYEHQLNLLPGSVPPELSKGHPLAFFFFASLWMRIFGATLVAKHCFALFISLLYLSSICYIVRKLFGNMPAVFATILTACQAVFLAQSSMLLPEIMLSLFTLWTLYGYLKEKWILFGIMGSLLILTKETGIFMLLLIVAWELGKFIFQRSSGNQWKRELQRILILIIPFLIFGLHLLSQKISRGWFFYPEHISLITGLSDGFKQLGFYSDHLFLGHRQYYIVIVLIISFVISFFGKAKFNPEQKSTLWLVFLFLIFYLLASSFLFFSPRYLISIHIMMIILCTVFLVNATLKAPITGVLITALMAGLLLHSAYYLRLNGDYDLGYVQAVKLQKQTVEYFENNKLHDNTLYAGFLIRENMSKPTAGFLRGETFDKFVGTPDENPDYLIFSNIEWDPNYDKVKNSGRDSLLVHYQDSWMWIEIYRPKSAFANNLSK